MKTFFPSLFEEICTNMLDLLQELDRIKLKHIFACNKEEIQLSLSDHYLFLYRNINSQVPTHYCKLTFSIKFEVIYKSVFVICP